MLLKMGRVIALLVLAVALVQAGPLKKIDSQCSQSCTGSGKLNYEVGRTYTYRYDSDIQSAIVGAMEDHAGLHLSSDVQIEVLSKCELVMRMTDVKLTEYDQENKIMKAASSEFKKGLERNPIRISFQDGNVEEICLTEREPDWVVNAKRGLLSLFQTTMADFSKNETVKETDVSGTCETEYYAKEDEWYTTNIGKSKKLHTCTDRHRLNTVVQGVPYTANSEYQSMPIIKSEQNCEYKINKQGQYVTYVHCQENHMFRPFSKENSGAVTKNEQTLTFIDFRIGTTRSGPSIQKVSLRFNHNNEDVQEPQSKRDLTLKLKEICEKTELGVRPETPRLFTELVYIMKRADILSLNSIYTMLEKGTICKDNNERTSKFFLDALPLAGTGASLNLMVKLLTTKEVTGVIADMWITSLAFVKNPDTSVLMEVKPLINMKGSEDKTLMSIGTLIHSYCNYHDCQNDRTVRDLVSDIENTMAPRCKINDANYRTTLMALRAIGNAGFAESAVPSLDMCMRIKSNPIEIRLSAIDAFRRIPCSSSRNALITILKDADEDAELRIAAYKSIMECPTEEILNTIRRTLEKEEIKQVGSYIWSHLTNLMETSDRHKQGIRAILEDETFKKEFDLDMRKYSRNYEKSMFIEPVNSGAKIEADLIFSPKSFLPRSGMLNLTVDLFGQSVNLMEFGGRVEGLEYFFEAFIGPNGYFGDAASQKSNSNKLALKSVRQDKIKMIDKRFESQAESLRASLYMRVFGNELKYYNFRGLDDLMTGQEFNVIDFFSNLAKDNDATYSYSSMFLGSSIIIPTGSGFPMNLNVNGTSTMDLKLKGKMDLKNMDIVGYVKPSAAIDISSMMSVDAFVTKCGIKMVSTLHTSTSVQGKLHLSPAGDLTAEYEMPQNKMEVFDFKTSFFTVHREQEREQKMIQENRQMKRKCSPAKLVTVTGLELCTEISYPNASLQESGPYFPLTGPVSGGIYLFNRDTHMKYTLNAKSQHTKDRNVLQLTFDTPGSKIDRHISLNMILKKTDMSLDFTLTSPWQRTDLQGLILNTKKTKGITVMLNDGSKSYSVKAKVDLEENPKSKLARYTPSIQVQFPVRKPINIQAIVLLKALNVFSIDFDMDGVLVNPVEAKVSIKNTKGMKSFMGSIDTGNNSRYSLTTNLGITSYSKKRQFKPLISVRSPTEEVMAIGGTVNHVFGKKVDYSLLLDKIVKKKVTLKGNFQQLTYRRGRVLYGLKTDFRSAPMEFGVFFKVDNKNFRSLSTTFNFNYINRGVLIKGVSRNGIQFFSKINNLSSSSLTKATGKVNLVVKKNPEYNLAIIGNVDHKAKLSSVFADIKYGKDFKDTSKQIDIDFKMTRNFKSWIRGDAEMESKFRFPGMDLNLVLNGQHSHSDRHIDSSIYLKGGKTFVVDSELHWKDSTSSLIAMTGNYSLTYPGLNFMVRESINQETDHTYVFKTEVQPRKNQMHYMLTQLDVPSPKKSAWKLSSDITLDEEQPIHLEGFVDPNPMNFVSKASYMRASKNYAGSIVSKTTDVASDLKMEVESPERHVVMTINGALVKDKYSGFADFKWDAAKDSSKKIRASFWLVEPTEEKINGSASLSYPSRDLTFNLLHQVGAKYSTRADFQWEKNKKISADTTLGIRDKSIICTANFATPFKALPALDMKLSHTEDNEEYLTNVNMDYGKSESVNVELKLKKPLSLKTFVGYFVTTTSVKEMKRVRVDFDHKLNPYNKINSMLKLQWNKQQVKADFELTNTTKGNKVGFTGDLTLKTTIPYMKKGIVRLSHDSNGMNFNTVGSFQRNKKLYSVTSKISHSPSKASYSGTGKIDLSTPSGDTSFNWDHKLSTSSLQSSSFATWGRKGSRKVALRVNGKTKDMSLGINLDTPFKSTGDIEVKLGLDKDITPYKASMEVKQNGAEMASVSTFFDHSKDITEGKTALKIPAFNIDSRVSGKHAYVSNGLTTEFEAIVTPSYTVEVSSVINRSEARPFAHTVIFDSSFESLERMIYTAELRQEQMNAFTTKVEYGNKPMAEFQTNYKLQDNESRVHFLMKTPYENMQSLSGDVSFAGSADKFNADTSIEIAPLLGKKSASIELDMTQGLAGRVELDTPFHKVPRISADINASIKKESSDVSMNVAVQTTPCFNLKFNHDLASPERKSMSGNVAYMTSSYGVAMVHTMKDDVIRSDVSLYNDNSKYAGAAFTFRNATKMESLLVISPPAKQDIELSLTQDGPSTHFEMRHNPQNHFTYNMDLYSNSFYKMEVRSSWKFDAICQDDYDSRVMFELIPNKKLTADGHFTKSSVGKSEFDLLFDVTKAIEGNLIIKSPLIKNIKASFTHVFGNKYIDSKASLFHGGKEMAGGTATLNYESSVVGEVTLRSALTKMIQANLRYDGKLENFVISVDGSYGKEKASTELSSKVSFGVLHQKLSISSTMTRDLSVEISHLGPLERFTCFGEFNYGFDKHRLDLSYQSDTKLDWSISLTSPLVHPISSRLMVTGTPQNFQGHVEFVRNTDRSDVNVELDTKSPKLSGSIDITSPYMKDISFSVEHTGAFPKSCNCFFKLALDKNEIYDGRMMLVTKPTFESSISINTPSDRLEGLVQHEGQVDNFKSHAIFSFNADSSELDVNFKSLKKVEGLVSLKSGYLPKEMSLSFDHSGELENFNSHAEFNYGTERTEVDMELNVVKDAFISISANIPRKPKMTASLRQTGDIENFNLHGEYLYGTKRNDVDFTIAASDSFVTSTFSLVSPLTKEIKVNMKHEGSQRNFVTTGAVSVGREKSEATMRLNLDGLETSVEMISPSYTVNFTHSGAPSDFKTSFDLENEMDRYTGMVKLFVGKTVDLDVQFISPIPGYEVVSVQYTHKGSNNNFQCHAELVLPEGKSETDLKVDMRDINDMTLTFDLTPIARYNIKSVKTVYTFKNTEDSELSTEMIFNYGQDESKIDIILKPTEGLFTLNSAYIPTIRTEYDITNNPSKYSVNGKLAFNGIEKGHILFTMVTRKDLDVAFSLKVPVEDIPKVNGDMSISMTPTSLRQSYNIFVDNAKKGSLDFTLDLDNKIEGALTMDVLSDRYSVDMSFTKGDSKYTGKSDVKVNHVRKAGFVSSLDLNNGVVTALEVDTPFKNFSRINVNFHIKGDLPEFELLALIKNNNKELFKLDGKFTSTLKFSGDFSLTSALCTPKAASFDIEGSLADFTFSGSLMDDREPMVSSSAEFFLSKKPIASKGFLNINAIKMAYNFEAESHSVKSSAEVSDSTSRFAMEASFSKKDAIESSLTVNVPEIDPIKASFFHSLKAKLYTTQVHLELDRLNVYEVEMSLGLKQRIVGEFTLKTPFESMRQTQVNVKHVGELPYIQTSVEMINNNEKLFKATANIPAGELSLKTPFEGFENTDVTFYHEGESDNFRMGGTLVYDSGKEVKVDVEHQLNGNTLSSRFSFTSMYTEEIVLTAYHTGAPTDFLCKYGLSMGTDNKIILDKVFKLSDTALEYHTTATTTMSGETFTQKADVLVNGTPDNLNAEVSVENNGKAIRIDSFFKDGPILEGSIKVVTPFDSYEEMKASFSHRGEASNFVNKFEIQYMPTRTISGEMELVNKGWNKMDTTIVFKTPFQGLEESRMVYRHSGDSNSFQCDPVLSVGSAIFSGTIKASKAPLSMSMSAQTPFKGFRYVGFESNVEMNKKGRYGTRMETSWGRNKVTLDGSFSSINDRIQAGASLSTPFDDIRRASVEFVHHDMPTKYADSVLATFNGENLLDFEVDFNLRGENKHFLTTVRSPQPMKFEISGDFTPMFVDMDVITNLNTADSRSEMKLEASYDLRFTTKKANFKLTRPGQIVTYNGEFALKRSKSDLAWGITSAEKTGFDLIINKNDGTLKVMVPGEHARVLELNGFYNTDKMEADFLWDADGDRSKKFGVRTVFTDRTNTLKGAVSIYVPALQRTIQMESDVSLYRGRVIFDGKLSFSFSRDERKKVSMMARVEDVSIGPNSMNYSMTFGLNQPYTNVGIGVYSHLGKSNSRYSAVMGMEYLTGKRQTKTFHMGGELDRKNNFMSFEMVNPLKTLNISTSVKTQNGFQISTVNKYDQKKPLMTELTVNPTRRSISFKTNYDLEHPTNELQIQAEYVNSSALRFEVSRAIDYKRITDVLVTAQLNNSHLLHSGLHWRPEILTDLEAYYNSKMENYERRMKETTFDVGEALLDEIHNKATSIHSMIEGDIGRDNMRTLEQTFSPLQFYIISFVNRAVILSEPSANTTWTTYDRITSKYDSLLDKTQVAVNSMESPFMLPLPMDKPFDYALEMVNLQVKHLPSKSVEALKYARHVLPEGLNSQLASMNKNWDLEDNYKSASETVLKMIEKEIAKNILRLKKIVTSPSVSPLTVYDLKHGEIQAEFHLPIPLKSLDVKPVINYIKYFEMVKEKMEGVSFRVPEMSGEWLPPYTGTAMVSQGKKITTFDGFNYDLDNDCTFILTKDYRDGNFTIIRSNGEDPSITVLSQNKAVELKLTGEVFVDGEAVKLPIRNNMMSISQSGETVAVDGKDFNMLFDLSTDHLTVKINGWYFGKTGGLLGIYDNEPSNDFMTSFGKVIHNENRFMKTWEVGTATCR